MIAFLVLFENVTPQFIAKAKFQTGSKIAG